MYHVYSFVSSASFFSFCSLHYVLLWVINKWILCYILFLTEEEVACLLTYVENFSSYISNNYDQFASIKLWSNNVLQHVCSNLMTQKLLKISRHIILFTFIISFMHNWYFLAKDQYFELINNIYFSFRSIFDKLTSLWMLSHLKYSWMSRHQRYFIPWCWLVWIWFCLVKWHRRRVCLKLLAFITLEK